MYSVVPLLLWSAENLSILCTADKARKELMNNGGADQDDQGRRSIDCGYRSSGDDERSDFSERKSLSGLVDDDDPVAVTKEVKASMRLTRRFSA